MATLILRLIAGSFLKRFMMTAEGELKAGWTWITSSAVHACMATILVLCALLGFTRWHDSHVIAKKDRIIASQGQEIEGMKAASAANLKAQLAQKAAVEQHYKDIANEADKEHAIQLADANDALSRYIASHRVRAEGGSAGGSIAGPASESSGAQSSDGPGSVTELVTVSPDDLRICTMNTTRLQAVRDWALSLERQSDQDR